MIFDFKVYITHDIPYLMLLFKSFRLNMRFDKHNNNTSSNLYEIIQIYISFFLHLTYTHIAGLKYINIQYFFIVLNTFMFHKKNQFFPSLL